MKTWKWRHFNHDHSLERFKWTGVSENYTRLAWTDKLNFPGILSLLSPSILLCKSSPLPRPSIPAHSSLSLVHYQSLDSALSQLHPHKFSNHGDTHTSFPMYPDPLTHNSITFSTCISSCKMVPHKTVYVHHTPSLFYTVFQAMPSNTE